MARAVRLTDEAAESLGAIERWYRQPGAGAAAARHIRAILACIARLEIYPFMGRPGDISGTRVLVCQGHRIIYEVSAGEVPGDAGDVLVLDVFGPGEP